MFFSWQSDIPGRVGRNLVEQSLERAIRQLQTEAEIDSADRDLALDRDTLNIPGSPPIMETIFGKIDRAAVFVADMTYVAERSDGGRSPNPNVCIEHGYALKAMTWRRVIAVMNTAFGDPNEHELPFDIRHTRWPLMFACSADADTAVRRAARDDLTAKLIRALRAVLGDEAAQASLAPAIPTEPHPHDIALLDAVHRQLSSSLRAFLHRHNFGTPFRVTLLDPLHGLNDWVGARYEFHDTVLQAAFSEVRRHAEMFCELISERIYPMNGDHKIGWPKTDLDVAQGLQNRTLDAIRGMNERAMQLGGALDAFDRVARDRLRIASTDREARDKGRENERQEQGARELLQKLASDVHRGALPEIVSRPRLTLRLIPLGALLGSGLTDQSQKMTVAASAMAEKKAVGQRS